MIQINGKLKLIDIDCVATNQKKVKTMKRRSFAHIDKYINNIIDPGALARAVTSPSDEFNEFKSKSARVI
jgi:hypothetical protein